VPLLQREPTSEDQNRERPDPDRDRVDGSVATIVGLVLAVIGLLVSVLSAAASLAVAALGVGLIVGLVSGVLLTPSVRRAAAWLSEYLRR
jgi:hypothetical protein